MTAIHEDELWDKCHIGIEDLEKRPITSYAFIAYILDTAKVKTFDEYRAMTLTELQDLFETDEDDEAPKAQELSSEVTEQSQNETT